MRVSLGGNKAGQRDRGEARVMVWAPQSPGSGALGRRPACVSRGPTVRKEWGRRQRRGARGCRGLPRGLRSGRGCEDLGSRAEAALVGSLQGFRAFTLGTTTSHPGAGAAWLLSAGLSPTRCCLSRGGDPCLRPPSGQGQAVHRARSAHGVCCSAGRCAAVLGPPGLTQRPPQAVAPCQPGWAPRTMTRVLVTASVGAGQVPLCLTVRSLGGPGSPTGLPDGRPHTLWGPPPQRRKAQGFTAMAWGLGDLYRPPAERLPHSDSVSPPVKRHRLGKVRDSYIILKRPQSLWFPRG